MKSKFLLLVLVLSWSLLSQATPPVLRWAADTESGYPFVFLDPQNPQILNGFEYELISEIAVKLGRQDIFVQNAWDGLIPGLQRDQYDVAINGVEITPDREKEILFSKPYFITYEQLVVRKDEAHITQLKDCAGKKVGTLKLSVAEKILQEHPSIETLSYESESNAFEDLRHHRLDAVLLDAPIAQYYAGPDPQLKLVGEPIGKLLYGIGLNKKDFKLKQEVDQALHELEISGRLREIYMSWNLWNPLMESYFTQSPTTFTPPFKYERIMNLSQDSRPWLNKARLYWQLLPTILQGAWVTLQISVVAMILAMTVGLILTFGHIFGSKSLRFCVSSYIELMRGTPLLIQLFFIYYALPHMGINLSPWWAAVLGLGLNYAANESENYRAGIQSVPKEQTEAAIALGLTHFQTLRHVVLPQAFKIVLPPITNDFIALLKDSSLVSVITMVELTKLYGQLASTYYDYIGIGIIIGLAYLLLGLPFVRLARHLEKKMTQDRF